MNPFTSTNLNYDIVQDRRHSFEQAAARRRLLRFSARSAASATNLRRPPDPAPAFAPVLTLVDATTAGQQHLPAAPVSEPTTVRVA